MGMCFVHGCREPGKVVLYIISIDNGGLNFCDMHADKAMKLISKSKLDYFLSLTELEVNLRNIPASDVRYSIP